ncbi:hypothetical protein EK21DRAFT_94986 [Setomelanomma holmii]|uniref:RING-type domain-containing protein n=1 Tax=Setomelanomma holmii TaxID=210430 RepID=A0A9P4GV97_9PLEO|nr:hypothetical protein EK21DRAFT_94986 [Setomelanomma holmii]
MYRVQTVAMHASHGSADVSMGSNSNLIYDVSYAEKCTTKSVYRQSLARPHRYHGTHHHHVKRPHPQAKPSQHSHTAQPISTRPLKHMQHPSVKMPSDRASSFLTKHTDFLSHADGDPPNTNCPICLDSIEEHICVKIVNIPGCGHVIGMKCLEELLKRSPDDRKECPLCRAVWIEEDGIWQGSEEWNALANGGGGGHSVPLIQTPFVEANHMDRELESAHGYGHGNERRPHRPPHDGHVVRGPGRTPTLRHSPAPEFPSTSSFGMSSALSPMHPLGPMFGNVGHMGAFGLRVSDIMPHHDTRSTHQQHGASHWPSNSHGPYRQPHFQYGVPRAPREPLHNAAQPSRVGARSDGSSRPSYAAQQSHQHRSSAGRPTRVFQDVLDAFYGTGTQPRGSNRDIRYFSSDRYGNGDREY